MSPDDLGHLYTLFRNHHIMNKLTFGKGNAKLGADTFTFSLPAGHTCPGASACLARVGRLGGLTHGKNSEFQCFSATAENMYPAVRKSRWANMDLLKGLSTEEIVELILASLPSAAGKVRIHVSGDFFSEAYFQAWLHVAKARPSTVFYAYTKSLNLWVAHKTEIPANMMLNASHGGRFDHLIAEHGLKSAIVVFSVEQAAKLGLEIDDDESHAYQGTKSFALLLHGQQPKGTPAAKALSALFAQGHTGYSKKSQQKRLEQKQWMNSKGVSAMSSDSLMMTK